MFKVFGNAWKVPELRKRMLFALLVIVIYRLGANVMVPFIDSADLHAAFSSESVKGSMFGYFSMLAGDAFSNATLFALGVSPYITASIVIQLLTIAIPALERIAKSGPEGQAKISRYTRYVTIALAIITSYGYYATLKSMGMIENKTWFAAVVIIACHTAGACLVMWLGERIDEKGIGNGISIILFVNIVSSGPALVTQMFEVIRQSNNILADLGGVLAAIVMMLIIITLVVFFSNSERRLPVQYAKRQVGRKMYGGANTHLPIKIMMGGVMPVIFASAIVSLPSTLALIFNGGAFEEWVKKWFSSQSVIYVVVMFALIIAFAYFYIAISFNTVEVANNLKANGGTILGYRPGQPTAQYIQKVVNRVTLIGALFLSFMAIFPILMSWTGSPALSMLVYGGTSVIIAVDVALQTTRDIESETTMRHYKGFLG
ncbi:MAG: preprotein translocase subunit SecY [Clostridia bacterium]|nr:preprotein translocase subunit SecY [Clostridia bacterium]